MKCPVCPDSTLVLSDRQGVEIDYCPSCRGVWLDRGELDKLIDRATAQAVPAPAAANRAPSQPRQPDFVDSDQHRGYGYRKRKNWLSDIFD